MRFLALATDYDGTLAANGRVEAGTLAALRRLRASGRKAILVTGRELPDLKRVFPRLDLFDRVVAENGALLLRPRSGKRLLLAAPPPPEFVARLRARGVPVSVGRAIVATRQPYQAAVLQAIHELGLDLHIIFNKESVMVLPTGINKVTGLQRALEELQLAPDSVAGIGDAENDHPFLALCGCAAAVANALPAVKDRVDLVTAAAEGAGVVELINQLLDGDLALRARRRPRRP
jgi:hypothetical protein